MIGPGYDRSMPSTMVSRWHRCFVAMGYPELDLVEYPDGEKAIIQYFNRPIIPSLTRWGFVLTKIRNQDINYYWLKEKADDLNLEKKKVWAEQEAIEKEALRRQLEEDRRSEDFATRMLDTVQRNDAWMQRIAKNGLGELNPLKILNHIPRYRLGKGFKEKG
jgi:hypothetical protein